MSTLEIRDLVASVAGKTILNGITLTVNSGEVHAVMGPNGAGKSTLSAVVMGKPGYEVLGGSVLLDGVDMLALPAWQRAQAGLASRDAVSDGGARRSARRRHASRVRGAVDADGRCRSPTARRSDTDRFRPGAARASAQRRLLGWREEAQRDVAGRDARAEDRHPRRARLRVSTSTPFVTVRNGSRH